jgi:hypothetical protein
MIQEQEWKCGKKYDSVSFLKILAEFIWRG